MNMRKIRNILLLIILIQNICSWFAIIPQALIKIGLVRYNSIDYMMQYATMSNIFTIIWSLIFSILLIIVVILTFLLQNKK
jgi:hypothetical protein